MAHIKEFHSNNEESTEKNVFVCELCNSEFESRTDARDHFMKYHRSIQVDMDKAISSQKRPTGIMSPDIKNDQIVEFLDDNAEIKIEISVGLRTVNFPPFEQVFR